MPKIEKTVFISYRRSNIYNALAVYQDLTAHDFDVFFDFESINSGDFKQIIFDNIKARAHFVIILTPSSLERCIDPDDWLRREVECALEHKRNIVPLMMEGFDYSSPSINKYLTGKLELLKNFNAQRVPADFFPEAMQKIRERFLNTPIDAVLYPLSENSEKKALEQKNIADAQATVTQDSLTAEEFHEQAGADWVAGNFDDVIKNETKAIALKPDFSEAYAQRAGAILTSHGNTEEALEDCMQAIELDPNMAIAYHNRGMVYRKKGDNDRALEDYNTAVRLNAWLIVTYNNRGNIYLEKEKYDHAIADYDEAIRLDPDYVNAYNNRGLAYQNKGEYDRAIADYEQALSLDPNHESATSNLKVAQEEKHQQDGGGFWKNLFG